MIHLNNMQDDNDLKMYRKLKTRTRCITMDEGFRSVYLISPIVANNSLLLSC